MSYAGAYDSAHNVATLMSVLNGTSLTYCSVESLTGGGFGACVTQISGASKYYVGGLITYTAEQKISLADVPAEIIAQYTVYSTHCAQAMAIGGLHRLHSDLAISFTGVAGPGSDQGVPAGTVFISIAQRAESIAERAKSIIQGVESTESSSGSAERTESSATRTESIGAVDKADAIRVRTWEYHFYGNRNDIRDQTINAGISLFIQWLTDENTR